MSWSNNTPTNAASPAAVMNDLKQQAERKAAYKMFYSAADVFREYKGPYAADTAAERERLTAEYDQRGRDAEKQRLEGGPRIVTPKPATPAQPYRPPTPITPRAVQPKPASTTPRPVVPRKEISTAPAAQLVDGKISFACRWCKETIAFEPATIGQVLPCPKCDSLICVPKV